MRPTAGTISEVIEEGKDKPFTHGKLHFKEKIDLSDNTRIIINYESLFRKYRDIIQPYIRTVELTDKQMQTYIYQPRRFCAEFYGNIELWSALLWVNGMTSSSEFTRKVIRSFAQGINDILMELMGIEIDALEDNYIDMIRD